MTSDTERSHHDLTGSVVRGVGWIMTAQGTVQILALVTSVVIARFLGPREVGLAAEALVFGSLALLIVDFGFGSAIIQRPALSEDDKSTAFWAGTVLGVATMLIGIGLSWPIAAVYGEPRVQPLFAVLSLSFLFAALGIVQGALLSRELRFRSLEVRKIIATTVSAATAISLAVLGFGAWAIVVQTLVISGVSTALLWRTSPWRPQARFSMASLRSMGRYASHVFGSASLTWGTSNVDNFLIGRFIGAAQLGAYAIAYSLIVTPVRRIAYPLIMVFFPAFAKMRDPERIASGWLRGNRILALVVVPSMLGLIAVAPDFVTVAFGDRWNEAVPVIQILAPVGLIQSLTALNVPILQAVARTRTLFRFTLLLSVVTIAAFAAGLPWGINGVATAYLVVTVIMQPVFLWLTLRAVGLTMRDWLRSIAGVVQAGVAMLLIVLGARELLLETALQVAPRLAALIVIGALTFVPLVAWRAPEIGPELRWALGRLRRGPQVAAPETPEAPV